MSYTHTATITLPRQALATMVKHLAKCTEKSRSVLSGILLSVQDSHFTTCATDGKILLEYHLPSCVEHSRDFYLIIEPGSLYSASKIWQQSAKDCSSKPSVVITLEYSAGGAWLSCAETGSRAAFDYKNGTYPPYRNAIPSETADCGVRLGFNSKYMAIISAGVSAFARDSRTIMTTHGPGRGYTFEPMVQSPYVQARGLVMPVTLPA